MRGYGRTERAALVLMRRTLSALVIPTIRATALVRIGGRLTPLGGVTMGTARPAPGLKKRAGAMLRPFFENPGQGDNPNIALTRPQIIGPLTLVGQ